ncbi:MAG: hypothetical protein FD143_2884 [Ignavibacteria bacterium]|nr:MAG: hypothetical protein FD143_2884 [Ignavibacteria bacterium]KAF0155288.1 MAG: hypothetical protein FD188_3163 [Ignavibacteria bacterium]
MKRKVFVIAATISLYFFSSCSEQVSPTPDKIAEFQLSRVITGKEAKDFVNRLHFNSVTTERNEIAFYRLNNSEAVIYVTFYNNELDSYQNFDKMTKKISPDNSVFEKGAFLNVKGKRVYQTFGLGQSHFVFTHKKLLFWISAENVSAKEFLISYLEYIELEDL